MADISYNLHPILSQYYVCEKVIEKLYSSLTDSPAVLLTGWRLRHQVLLYLVYHPVYFREKDQIRFPRLMIRFDHHPHFLY